MKHRITNLLVTIGVFTFLIGCGDTDVKPQPTFEDQLAEQIIFDSTAISDYLIEKGYDLSSLDTTEAGAIYLVLDEGSGNDIEFNDIVNLYLSWNTTDTLIWSNIDTVLQRNDRFDSSATYTHLVVTHTSNGWALAESNFLSLQGFTPLREGMSQLLSEINVGGRGFIVTPSVFAAAPALAPQVREAGVPIYKPLIFEIYPTFVRK